MKVLTVCSMLLVSACSVSKADEAPLPHSMTCQVMTFDGTQGRRCENDEAVCYLTGEALSCLKK